MSELKCEKCGKVDNSEGLPYQWADIHQKSSGVHDSSIVMHEKDYCLCPDCRIDGFGGDTELVEALEAIVKIIKPIPPVHMTANMSNIYRLAYVALEEYKGKK